MLVPAIELLLRLEPLPVTSTLLLLLPAFKPSQALNEVTFPPLLITRLFPEPERQM